MSLASKCGESDVPVTDVLRLAIWLMCEVVRCLLNVDDRVVSGKSNEGMKLTERGTQKISDAWGVWPPVIMRCEKHGHKVLMDAHWCNKSQFKLKSYAQSVNSLVFPLIFSFLILHLYSCFSSYLYVCQLFV